MSQFKNFSWIWLVLIGFLNVESQNTQITAGHNSGSHLYEGETITAPGSGIGQIGISGNAQVDYKATNLINLREGFEAGGFSGNGFFHAYIAPPTTDYSGGLFDNNSFNEIEPSTSKAVGYTPGASNVSPTGAATYSIPIQLPPGTNGMVPSLSINYNSQAGNGILGMGWSLGGISAITRVPKTIYHNGKVAPVMLDNTDDFSLDGNRLIKVDGVYHTEQESFSKITTNSLNSFGPQGFTVISKNGITTEYGLTDDSKFKKEGTEIVLFWLINKVYDQYGNYVKYVYKQEGNEIVLDRVLYTGNENAGLSPYNVVKFKYELRSDKNTEFVGSAGINTNSILKEITIIADGQSFKSYKFKYGLNLCSYLREIYETGADGSEINPTVFKYGSTNRPLVSEEKNLKGGIEFDIFNGDFNGDGYEDILKVHNIIYNNNPNVKGNDKIEVFINNEGGFTSIPISTLVLNDGHFTLSNGSIIPNKHSYLQNDFNGDGRDDIIIVDFDYTSDQESVLNFILRKINVYFSNTDGSFNSAPSKVIIPPIDNFEVDPRFQMIYPGDFDGDGSKDILVFHGGIYFVSPRLSNTFQSIDFGTEDFGLSSGGLGSNATSALRITLNIDGKILVADYDGDGKDEILSFNQTLPAQFTGNTTQIFSFKFEQGTISGVSILEDNNSQLRIPHDIDPDEFGLGDFNSDGRIDILIKGDDHWYTFFSDGSVNNGFTINPIYLDIEGFSEENTNCKVRVVDINGDGYSDIFYTYRVEPQPELSEDDPNRALIFPYQNQIDYYLSNGLNFTRLSNLLVLSPNGYVEGFDPSTGSFNGPVVPMSFNGWISQGFEIGNFNGDSYPDILQIELDPNKNYRILNLFDSSKEKYLVSIKDGFGRVSSFDYTWLPRIEDNFNSIPENSFPLANFRAPVHLVSSFSNPNGIGGNSTIEFLYKGGTIHKLGKGFLGFKKVISSNFSLNITTETNFGLYITTDNKYFATYLENKKSYNFGNPNQLISGLENTYSFIPIVNTDPDCKVFISHLDGTIQNDFLNTFETTTNYVYWEDAYGNLKNSTTSYSGTNQIDQISYGEYVAFGSHIPWQPSYIIQETTRGNSFSIKTSFNYSLDKGSLNEIIKFSDKQNYFKLNNTEFDIFGNITKSIVSNQDPNSGRLFKFDYETKGRFPKNETNPLGQTSELIYSNLWGKLIWSKGVDNLTSSIELDAWGRLKKIIDPHGNVTSSNYSWSTNAENGLFSIQTQKPGSPEKTTFYDILEREIKTKTIGFGNIEVFTEKSYDSKGNIATETAPYFTSGSFEPVVTSFQYDNYNRPSNISNSIGSTTYSYSASGGQSTTSVNDPAGKVKSKTVEATGKVVYTSDNGGTLNYVYDAYGLRKIQQGGTDLETIGYDLEYGWQNSLKDINGGEITYNYNTFNQLVSQSDPLGLTTTFTYDALGRLSTKTYSDDGQIVYTYYTSGNGINKLMKVSSPEGSFQEYEYDGFGRQIKFKEKQGLYAETFTTSYTYNDLDQLTSTKSPSGFVTKNNYDNNGYLTSIKDVNNQIIFSPNSTNSLGQLTNYSLGNGKITQKDYDKYGFLERIYSPGIQDLETRFNIQSGNLESRSDNIKSLSEEFTYDNLDRLKNTHPYDMTSPSHIISDIISGPFEDNITYSLNGNILTKTGIGNYYYESNKPNALTAVDNNRTGELVSPLISTLQQNITYHHDLPSEIQENGYEYKLKYGVDDRRLTSELKNNNTLLNRHFYSLNYEKIIFNNETYQIDYIPSDVGLTAIYVRKKENSSSNYESGKYFYCYNDHLGSLLTLTDEDGVVVYEQNFDSWGNRRNSDTWAYNSILSEDFKWLNRGFTGHEHMPEFGLINMNARLYDPLVGRFLAVDNEIFDSEFSQSYNRYSYCLNNPLKYIDPSGEQPFNSVLDEIMNPQGINWNSQESGLDNLFWDPIEFSNNFNFGDPNDNTMGGKQLYRKRKKVKRDKPVLNIPDPKEDNSKNLNSLIYPYFNVPKDRPWDNNWDGILQKNEADHWWLYGNGKTIWVDASLIDFTGLKIPEGTPDYEDFEISTTDVFLDLKYEFAATYGGTSFLNQGGSKVRILDQLYHYNPRESNSLENITRNIMQWIGKPGGRNGVDFMIMYKNPTINIK